MQKSSYPDAIRRTGTEPFIGSELIQGLTLLGFWQWYASGLMDNTTRGVLAEYLVAVAVGVREGFRREWETWDVETATGVRIEVKSASYLQSWFQPRPSEIKFSIAPTFAWNREAGCYGKMKTRHADVYVFALLHHTDKATVNPMDVSQWTFYVMATQELNRQFPKSRSIRLSRLQKARVRECSFSSLRVSVEKVASTITRNGG